MTAMTSPNSNGTHRLQQFQEIGTEESHVDDDERNDHAAAVAARQFHSFQITTNP